MAVVKYVISVPGRFNGANAFVDLETVKTPTDDFVMRNGEALRARWRAAMAGVALGGEVVLLSFLNDEVAGLAELGAELAYADEVVYAATREFDEMILKGRFTNARRAHEPEPFFPVMPGAEDLTWRNVLPSARERSLGLTLTTAWRTDDIASKDVPTALLKGVRDVVLVHLLRDVVELILAAGRPDHKCRAWCERVLSDYWFAWKRVSPSGESLDEYGSA